MRDEYFKNVWATDKIDSGGGQSQTLRKLRGGGGGGR